MSHEIVRHLKELKLHGMAQSWPEMVGQTRLAEFDPVSFMTQLLRSESAEREVRSIAYQMTAARFPAHRDLQGFNFAESKVDESLVRQLHALSFLDAAHNLVFIGGPGTGKTHLATALGVEAIGQHGKRVRFFSTIELVNTLELEKAAGKQGQIAHRLMYADLVILDELGYLPFSQAGGALLFHLLSKLYERTSVAITTNLDQDEFYFLEDHLLKFFVKCQGYEKLYQLVINGQMSRLKFAHAIWRTMPEMFYANFISDLVRLNFAMPASSQEKNTGDQ